ncbi:MAG TPA: hypothetical protein VGG33_08475, partial [Polyangia bacterium]
MGKRPVGIIVGVTLTALLACSSNSGGAKPSAKPTAPRDAGAMRDADDPIDATKPTDVLMPM